MYEITLHKHMKKISLQDLGSGRLWKPHYGRFKRNITLQRLHALKEYGINEDALDRSLAFAKRAYSDFNRSAMPRRYGFVFVIPTRITRRYVVDTSEARNFLPIVDYITHDLAQVILSEMPPCVLDEYYDHTGNVVGAIVFAPLFIDMASDIRPRLRTYLKARKIVKETALYIRHQLQPDIIGLGATIPKVTRFGADMSRYGLRTTTGHGGTVYLIYMMFHELRSKLDGNHQKVGIIGAGSISASAAALLLQSYPDITLTIFDIRPKTLKHVVADLNRTYNNRCRAAASNSEVISSSTLIICAITSTIHVTDEMNLSGKVIIDDSQPGSFDRDEVERQGGKLVWVAGCGNPRLASRRGEFHFGDNGLQSSSDMWGCEAEVASLWASKEYRKAISEPVTPNSALAIGALMKQYGIKRAKWQSYGKEVTL